MRSRRTGRARYFVLAARAHANCALCLRAMQPADTLRAAAPPATPPTDLANELDLLLLGADDESTLPPELLRFLLDRAGLDGVWFGRVDASGALEFAAVAGDGMADYLERAGIDLSGAGPAAQASRSGLPQIVVDWASDPRTASLPEGGARAGWRGMVCLPLLGADGERDLLALYSRTPGFFQQAPVQRLVWHLHQVLGLKLGRIRRMHDMLRRGEALQLLRGALDSADFGVMLVDMQAPDQPLVYVNGAFTRLTGYAAEQVLGRNARLLHADDDEGDDEAARAVMRDALRAGRGCEVELRNRRVDGGTFWSAMSLSPIRDASGVVTHYAALMRDVSARRAVQFGYETTQGLYRALLAEEELVLNSTDLGEMLQQACERLAASGLFCSVLVGRAGQDGCLDLLAKAGPAPVDEAWYRPDVLGADARSSLAGLVWNSGQLHVCNDYLSEPAFAPLHAGARAAGVRAAAVAPVLRGGHRWAMLGVASARVGVFTPAVLELLERIARLIGHGMDAFDLRRRLQQEHRHISWLAEHDPLTGLLNRRGLHLRLEEALAQVDAQGGCAAVCILDFDDFKQVNDSYGHAAGDALLRTIAARLVEAVRTSDTVARLGGDEIVLVLQGLSTRDELEPMLQRVRAAIDAQVPLPGGEAVVQVRASLGLTVYPDDSSEPDDLLRHADQALYTIKQQPRGAGAPFWRMYRPSVDRDHFGHLRLVRERFAAGGLRVLYQPVVDMFSARVVEVEALSRLDDGSGRLIGPVDFIPLLGRDAQAAMTVAVLRRAVADAQQWQSELGIEVAVAVNVDPVLLASGEALAAVREIVAERAFPPKRIVLEILEHSDFLSLASAQDGLAELRAFGCRIALDDIGSAYSSLLRVKELPIDIIKLDQGFIRGLADRPQDLRFVQSLTQLARGLGVDFVAEGAETDDIVEALRALRVPMAQGFGIARPMPPEDFGAWLQDWAPRAAERRRGLLSCIAEQLVALDMDLMIAQHFPAPKPALGMCGDPAAGPLGQWLQRAGLGAEHALSQACAELYTMFGDWLQAGPDADDSMIQSALDHLLDGAGAYLRGKS